MSLRVKAAAKSDIGLVRRKNQDSFGMDEEFGLYVVCDGMGGAAGGEVASKLARDTFLAVAREEVTEGSTLADATERALHRATVAANRAVFSKGASEKQFRGMGTTLVGLRIEDARLTVSNVGDSRAYIMGNAGLRRLTADHSFVAEQVLLGLMTEEEAEASHMQSLITRAIGAEEDVHVDLFHETVQLGDTLLLTSDGLTRHVPDSDIATILSSATNEDPGGLCDRLIDAAKDNGGSDNITCIVLRVGEA